MNCGFGYGAVLKIQREFTLEKIYEHLTKMKECGMNQVVVWPSVYWWEDRTNPDYPFYTGKQILKYAETLDMKIIMELEGQITCLEYAPDFVMKEEYYPVDQNGHKMNCLGGYGGLNYSHPEVRQLIAKCFKNAAAAYKDFESLYGFDIYNETRFESFDIYTLYEFRSWLEKKYGDIERLNQSWERTYYDWSQIQFAFWMWASVMPVVDFNQFKKDYMADILRNWKTIVKDTAPQAVVIADNVYASVSEDKHYNLPQDDWSVARAVDEFGISLYPKNDSVGFVPYRRWLTLAGIHSASPSGNFWISELQSHNVSMFNPFSVVHEADIRWWNMEAIANGAKGIVYWKWDPFVKGVQTLGRGLVDVKGNETHRLTAAGKIAGLIYQNREEFIRYQPEPASCAILYDTLNHDFTKAYSKNHGQVLSDSIYLDSIDGLYHCLWNEQVYPDFVTAKEMIAGECPAGKVLFITSQVYMTKELSDSIFKFAEQGGTVICDGRFGMVDSFGCVFEDLPGGPCHDLLGIEFCDIEPEGLNITMENGWNQMELDGYYERQLWNLNGEDTKILGSYADNVPAIVEKAYGKGSIMLISTYLWYGYHCMEKKSAEIFTSVLADKYQLRQQYASEKEVKVGRLAGEDGELIFVFRYDSRESDIMIHIDQVKEGRYRAVDLQTKEEILTDRAGSGVEFRIHLGSQETAIYRLKQDS